MKVEVSIGLFSKATALSLVPSKHWNVKDHWELRSRQRTDDSSCENAFGRQQKRVRKKVSWLAKSKALWALAHASQYTSFLPRSQKCHKWQVNCTVADFGSLVTVEEGTSGATNGRPAAKRSGTPRQRKLRGNNMGTAPGNGKPVDTTWKRWTVEQSRSEWTLPEKCNSMWFDHVFALEEGDMVQSGWVRREALVAVFAGLFAVVASLLRRINYRIFGKRWVVCRRRRLFRRRWRRLRLGRGRQSCTKFVHVSIDSHCRSHGSCWLLVVCCLQSRVP